MNKDIPNSDYISAPFEMSGIGDFQDVAKILKDCEEKYGPCTIRAEGLSQGVVKYVIKQNSAPRPHQTNL